MEFQTHGGDIVSSLILERLLALGARLAEPGEFSKRAYLNGKLDLAKAEAVAALVEAKSAASAKLLARQMKGSLSAYVDGVREELTRMMAHSEVMIDYAEEDLPPELEEGLKGKLAAIAGKLRKTAEASKRRQGLFTGVKVAIVGKPNVGKSSLLNALLAYERAIVSDVAGTTRDAIEEEIRLGSHVIKIVDTAGIRNHAGEIEKIGIRYSRRAAEEAEILVALFDHSRPLDDDDKQILELVREYEEKKTVIVAVNKKELTGKIDLEILKPYDPLFLSAKEGVDALAQGIEKRLDALAHTEEDLLTSRRQIAAVEDAARAVDEAVTPLGHGDLELFGYHIQQAIAAVASITRPFEYGEMLDVMFGEFCLGK